MRSTFKTDSIETERAGARIGLLIGGVMLAGLAVFGLRRALSNDSGQVHAVTMEAMKFAPASVQIRPGDQVTFKNNDLVPHTVTAKPAGVFDSGVVKPGESWTIALQTGGTIHYGCTLHPMMEGEIVVARP